MLKISDIQEPVRALKLPKNSYVLFGSLPLLAYGLISQVNDIDILVNTPGWQYAQTLAWPLATTKGHQVIQLGNIDIYNEWVDMDVASVIQNASTIQGLPYASLNDVLHYKLALNRPKDQEHIRLIQHYLQSKNE